VFTFVVALIALIVAPQQTRRAARLMVAPVAAPPDSAPVLAGLAQARTRLTTANSALAQARARVATAPPVVKNSISPAVQARRDSLTTQINDLDALLTRVETAPITPSYAALAQSAQLTADGRMQGLLDSLSAIDRQRNAVDTSNAGSPVLAAMNARAADIGNTMHQIAEARRDTLRLAIARLAAPEPASAQTPAPAVDTAGWAAERDTAQSLVLLGQAQLADVRAKDAQFRRDQEAAREAAAINAPPMALLAAALVIGIVLGFGSALIGELRHATVADAHETERLTGVRVLATLGPRAPVPERARRSADREAPPFVDPEAGGYQLTYLHVARTGASRVMLTLTGSDTALAAVVAANFAAIAADEARTTLVVDTDMRQSPVAAALRLNPEPGFADILSGRSNWQEATAPTAVGRDRMVDVVPSGVSLEADASRVVEVFKRDAAGLTRAYDAILVVAPREYATAGLPRAFAIPDTVLCAIRGKTRIAELQKTVDALHATGANPVGIVVWTGAPPAFPTPDKLAQSARPPRRPRHRTEPALAANR
jgi:Mrp family chromosome partitioning ATPase